MANQELHLVEETGNLKLYRLLINVNGFGNKGDTVTFIRSNGYLWLVSNGVKKVSLDRLNISLCQQCQLVPAQT